MKKIAMGFLMLISVFLVSGCTKSESKVLNCTLHNNDVVNNYELNSEYEVTYKDNVVSKVKSTETVTSDDSEVLDYFEEYLDTTYSAMNENYGGYVYTVDRESDKVIANTTIDYSVLDLDQLADDQPTLKDALNSDGKITLDGIKDLYDSLGITCED